MRNFVRGPNILMWRGGETLVLAALACFGCSGRQQGSPPLNGKAIHEAAIIFDAHAHPNTPRTGVSALHAGEWSLDMELAPLVEGGLDAVFFSIPFLVEERGEMPDSTRVLAAAHAIVEEAGRMGSRAQVVHSAGDVRRAHSAGKLAVLLAIEARDPVGENLDILNRYHAAGVRMITLSLQPEDVPEAGLFDPENPPLGPFGKRVVRTMNRLGLLVDITHTPDRQQMEIIRASAAPVVASHSNARSLLDRSREISDSVILAIAEKGGVACVTFHPGHLSEDPSRSPATVQNLLDHIGYMVRLVGVDHVGFGSDFIGGGTDTQGLESPAQLPNLTAALLERGYSREDVHKILGGNLLRLLDEVERVADREQSP